jgi:ABC-type branched-subunit amino acid transport system substrate-binding protein
VDGTSGRLRVGACLSLSGRFAPFGRQAARGLQAWAALDGDADVLIEDDGSDVRQLQALLPAVAERCDLLLGPYSTVLMRAAGDIAAGNGWLIWNHGGSGDDVEAAHPGHVISVLTPTSRYMEPFLAYLAAQAEPSLELRVAHGKGRFGRQVAGGAERYARQLGFAHVRAGPVDAILTDDLPDDWSLITAGTFEDDTQAVIRAREMSKPPQVTCAVAAGVREFISALPDPDGTFGIAQWFLGSNHAAQVGPSERDFLDAYRKRGPDTPDYPAVQAAATASLAAHCARQTSQPDRSRLWGAATTLETATLYGAFKIDMTTGAQISHRTVLTRWTDGQLTAYHPSTSRARAAGADLRSASERRRLTSGGD